MTQHSLTLRTVTFWAVLVGITGFFLYIIGGLIWPIFYGLVFAILLQPFYQKMVKILRGHESVAALATILLAVVILIALGYLLGVFLVGDAIRLIDTVGQKFDAFAPQIQEFWEQVKISAPPAVSERLETVNLRDQIIGGVQNIAGSLLLAAQNFTANLVQIIVLSLITFYAAFYLIKNGRRWREQVVKILPLADEDAGFLASRFISMVRTSMKMVFVMGTIQGFLGGLIFALLGITAPVFWGFVFAILSLIPGLGHPIIWAPAAIILFLTGSPIKALILIVYGVVVMGLSDDLLRPYLIGKSARIHPFMILIGTLGGIATLGIAGLIVGPVIASLTAAVWELYRKEYAA